MSFDPLVSWSLIYGLILPGVIFSLYLSVRSMRRSALAKVLPSVLLLRLGSLLLFVLFVLNPYLEETKPDADNYLVGVVHDVSFSMSAKDCRGVSRFETMKALRANSGVFTDTQHRFVDVSFAKDFYSVGPNDRVMGGGSVGGDALKKCLDLYGESLGSIIFFSDGGINKGLSLGDASREARSKAIPISFVGLGSNKSAPDLKVEIIDLAKSLEKGRFFPLRTKVSRNFHKAGQFKLKIYSMDQLVEQREISFLKGQLEQEIEFQWREMAAGLRYFKAEVEPLANEQLLVNNIDYASSEVTGAKLKKIVWLSVGADPELRYFKHFVGQQEDYELDALLRLGDRSWLRMGDQSKKENLLEFPDLVEVDAVIMASDFSYMLNQDELALLRDFVQEKGGGLVCLGGQLSKQLKEIMPIEGVVVEQVYESRKMRLAETSVLVSTKAGDKLDLNGKFLLPSGQFAQGGEGLKLLGRSDMLLGDSFVLGTQPYGLGRVLWCGVSTWSWKLSSKTSEANYEAFWSRVVEWVSAGSRPLVQVHGAWQKYELGQDLPVYVDVLDKDFGMATESDLEVLVVKPNGVRFESSLRASSEYVGRFDLDLTSDQVGEYRLELMRGGELVRAVSFSVVPSAGESPALALNEKVLKEAAIIADGQYFDWKDFEGLQDLELKENVAQLTTKKYVMVSSTWLIVLLLTLGAEWLLRRRSGMS